MLKEVLDEINSVYFHDRLKCLIRAFDIQLANLQVKTKI